MRSGANFLKGRVVVAALFACNEFTFHSLKSLEQDAVLGKLGEGRDSGMNGHRKGRIVTRWKLIQRRHSRDVVVHFRILCPYGAE